MEKIEKVEGVYYTQNIDSLPIEERVFFREGLVVSTKYYRVATEQELNDWKKYLDEINKSLNLNNIDNME